MNGYFTIKDKEKRNQIFNAISKEKLNDVCPKNESKESCSEASAKTDSLVSFISDCMHLNNKDGYKCKVIKKSEEFYSTTSVNMEYELSIESKNQNTFNASEINSNSETRVADDCIDLSKFTNELDSLIKKKKPLLYLIWITFRSSGTEPKLKIYSEICEIEEAYEAASSDAKYLTKSSVNSLMDQILFQFIKKIIKKYIQPLNEHISYSSFELE